MLSVKKLGSLLSALSLTASGLALGGTANNAENLSQGIMRAKMVVDRAIASSGGSHTNPGGGSGGSGGNTPWSEDDEDGNVLENDSMALPILIQASASLGKAASNADKSKLAFLTFDFQKGNYLFALACNSMGISRSQIARANTAAMQVPYGYLAAFGPELKDTVMELTALKVSEGCP